MIKDKHIAVCVSGGIAAYKAAGLVSLLKKAGAEVRVCMTENACRFIAPLTFETLSKNPVITDTFSRETPYEVSHVALGKWADLAVVAPATANILAKAACGLADDYLSTFLLAAKCPVLFAPAMNSAMLHHPATQANLKTLEERGNIMIFGGAGLLACGDVGDGRMAEPEEIFAAMEAYFSEKRDFSGKKVLVTAGATRERIDDVRYLTNRSTGKMGYAVAAAAARRGAEVTLVSGITGLPAPKGVNRITAESAEDMFQEVTRRFDEMDLVVKAAAVADYTPASPMEGKMKKGGDFALELVRTKDILAELGARKERQVLVGFAAESAELERYALDKLRRKNLDLIAANDISRQDIGFASDENCLHLYFADGRSVQIEKCAKEQAAERLLDYAAELLEQKGRQS